MMNREFIVVNEVHLYAGHSSLKKGGVAMNNKHWWRWVESNYRSIGYEPIALTAEPHRHDYLDSISKKNCDVKTF